jgi:hypothetical protein
MKLAKKFDVDQNKKSYLCEDGAECGWGKILSDRFRIVGFPCPHAQFSPSTD